MVEQTITAKPQSAARKFPVKTLLILGAVMLIEGAAITAAFLLAGEPAGAEGATGAAEDAAAQAEQPVEVLVVVDKFPNTRSGRTYLYDTEVYIEILRKNKKDIEQDIENMRARITTDLGTIFRRAEPSHLLEPELLTVTRQIRAVLDKLLGSDEDDESYVRNVLVKKCIPFRADI